jgi:hypothetical protein
MMEIMMGGWIDDRRDCVGKDLRMRFEKWCGFKWEELDFMILVNEAKHRQKVCNRA